MIHPGRADEIIPGLWLGDRVDAVNWPVAADALCVLEGGPVREGQLWCPILKIVEGRQVAMAASLDEAAKIIRHKLKAGARLLVHCGAGVERSPLTVAWYLVKSDRARWPNMAAAYAHVFVRHAIASDRQFWLERQP